MRVKLLTGANAGQIEDVPFTAAQALVASGAAEALEDHPQLPGNIQPLTTPAPTEQATERPTEAPTEKPTPKPAAIKKPARKKK